MANESILERSEFVREVQTGAFGVVQKPLGAWERIWNLGAVR